MVTPGSARLAVSLTVCVSPSTVSVGRSGNAWLSPAGCVPHCVCVSVGRSGNTWLSPAGCVPHCVCVSVGRSGNAWLSPAGCVPHCVCVCRSQW